MIVYKITNLENGKIYVGQTRRTLEERFKEHCQADSAIGRAIRKHGKEKFKCEILETCKTLEELNEREKFWIKTFDCMIPKGYNKTDGGQSTLLAEEVRHQISESLIKFYEEHPEALEKISEEQKKRYADPEERAKAAERTRKVFEDPAIREKHAESQRKRFENPEEREKISATLTEHFSDPEERKKQSERLKKYYEDNPVTDEQRAKKSETQKKYLEEHPEARKNLFQPGQTHEVSPETRKKISEARKAYWARKREEKASQAEVEQLNLDFA